MVPPELNRYYVLDPAPGRSMVEYAVAQGIQVFMIVWRNPRPELWHGRWGLDDYVGAQTRAGEIVRGISGSETMSWLGLCAGGITTALALGYLAAKGDASAGSATFIVTMLTSDHPNIVGRMAGGGSLTLLKQAAASGRIFPGSTLRTRSPGCGRTISSSTTWSAGGCSVRTRLPSTFWPGTMTPPR